MLSHKHDIYETLPSTTHHKIIEITTTYKSTYTQAANKKQYSYTGFEKHNFLSEDVNWDKIMHELKLVKWSAEFKGLKPSAMLEKFTLICEQIALKYVPKKPSFKFRKSPPLPRDRKILMRRRRKITSHLNTNITSTRRVKLRDELIEIEKKLQLSYKNTIAKREQNAIRAIKNNAKYFYSYAKKFSKVHTSTGPLLNSDQEFIYSEKEMAELLSTQYSPVYSQPQEPLVDPEVLFQEEKSQRPSLLDFEFDWSDIEDAIDELSPSAAAGPDGFPSIYLKHCKKQLSRPLYLIWRKCLNLGFTPAALKLALVTPIHKGNSKSLPVNYRPIALTSHLIKIFEKIVRKRMVKYLEQHNLLNTSQHGFRQGHSCLSQLLQHHDKVLSLLEDGYNVDVIYLDFSKAFDKLDFNITMKKLKNLGISGKLGKWLHSFLTERNQIVVVNGMRSDKASVLSGVPQGSVIGPLLFLLLIGDIDEGLSCFFSSFADDSRSGMGVKTPDDTMKLQADLNAIYQWAHLNNMSLNASKFELLRYGRDATIKETTQYLSNVDQVIEEHEHVKDLGVYMSNTASFEFHISTIITRAKEIISWILRTFKSREKTGMMTLWKSLVLPRLDYCSQLWNPSKPGLIQHLEALQKSYVQKISGLRNSNYWDTLQELKLYSLQRRRERYQIIYLWSIIEQKVPNFLCNGNPTFRVIPNPRQGRKCFVQSVKRSLFQTERHNSLPIHGARLFNILPKYLRNFSSCSKDAFKRELDTFLGTVHDEPLVRGYTMFRHAETNSLLDMIHV